MHSSRLSDHPRITIHTDGGQSDGLFYFNGPIDYARTAAQPQMTEEERMSAWSAGTLVGEAEIVFSMEGVEALAMAAGDDDEIVTLRGPINGDYSGRHDEIVRQWFENPETATTLTIGQVQVKREDLRWLWRSILVDDVQGRLDGLGGAEDLNSALLILTGLRQWMAWVAPMYSLGGAEDLNSALLTLTGLRQQLSAA